MTATVCCTCTGMSVWVGPDNAVHGGVLWKVVAVVVKLTTPLDCRTAKLRGCRWSPGDVVRKLGCQRLVIPENPNVEMLLFIHTLCKGFFILGWFYFFMLFTCGVALSFYFVT